MRTSRTVEVLPTREGGFTIRSVQFRVLGPLEVTDDRGPVALGGPKQRRLLAVLISRLGEPVSADVLAEAVWDGKAPRSAAKTLQGYIVHLRQALAAATEDSDQVAPIVTTSAGYRLETTADAVDSVRFTGLLARGRQAAALEEWPSARVFLREGLSLWRGNAYAEFADSEFAEAEARRLEQLKVVALETSFRVDLELSEAAGLVPELEKALAQNPTGEPLWELLIRALYRAGRQSDALAAYGRARDVLATELGIDPGPGLQAVHGAVLAQDPSLDSSKVVRRRGGLSSRQPTAGVYAFDGREDDLAWLRSQWMSTMEQGGRIAVVSGPSGIGKTRLIATFANEVERLDAMVVRRTGLTAPNPATVVAVAAGRPALVALDDPLTGLDPYAVEDLPVLIVAGIDKERAPAHVPESLASAEWRELVPLTDDVCARIAHRWLADDGDGIDLDVILQAAGGIPGQLHRLLAEAIDERSHDEIDNAASELHSARADVTSRRARLARGVRNLRRGRAVYAAVPGAGTTTRLRSPYLGLETYDADDAVFFHGRDGVISQLVARVADTPLVAVVGASGSGKSSVVRAGLLVALADGCLPGSGSWQQFITTPADGLPDPSAAASMVVVDQFEQTWAVHDEQSRRRYLDALMALTDAGHRVVLALRADHVERCSEHPRLRDALADGTVLLGPMSSAELSEVIVGPADVAGNSVEPGLVDLVLDDVRGLPTPLPLLSTALADTWETSFGTTLTVDAYARTGGVAGSLARRAETVLAAMDPAEQVAVRLVFLRLAAGEPGRLVRRRCPYLEAANDEPARRAIEALVAARLITIDAATVEVTHEALFANWPRLTNWLEEDEQGRRLRAHLAPAAQEWDETGRPDVDLYSGVRLDAALNWAGEHSADLNPVERRFLQASQARADRELQTERARATREARGRRRLRVLLIAVAGAAVVAIAATVVALVQRKTAEQQRLTATEQARLAVARQLGAAALANQPLDRSLLLAVTATRMNNDVHTRSDLLTALQRGRAAKSVWAGASGPLYGLVASRDHVAIAAGLQDVDIWDLTGQRTPMMSAPSLNAFDSPPVFAARPGTDQVALGNFEKSSAGSPRESSIQLWDVRRQQSIDLDDQGSNLRLSSLSWSADGHWLAAAQIVGDVLVWDVADLSRPPMHVKRVQPIAANTTFPVTLPAVAYAGDGKFVIVEDSGQAQISRLGSSQPVRTFFVGAAVSAVATDPRGATLAVGRADGSVALFSLSTGRSLPAPTGHAARVESITFSADGHLLATTGDDNYVNLSTVGTGRLRDRLAGHAAPTTGAVFSADDGSLFTSSIDGTVIGWDIRNLNNLGQQLQAPGHGPNQAQITSVDVSLTGEIATEYADGTVRFWDSGANAASSPIHVTDGRPVGGAFSPDGRLFATAEVLGPAPSVGVDPRTTGEAHLIDVQSRRVIATLAHTPAGLWAVAFSPSGKQILVTDDERTNGLPGKAFVIDTASRTRIGNPFPVITSPRHVVWSPDSRKILVEGLGIEVIDMDSHDVLWRLDYDDSKVFAWSPDGSTIAAVGGHLRTFSIQLLRSSDGANAGGWIDPTVSSSYAYSPDWSMFAAGGDDGTVLLRNVATGEQVGPPLVAASNQPVSVLFGAAGNLIVSSEDGGLWRWNVSLPAMLDRACAIAGRNLTSQEWADLHTNRPYSKACP
jgi:DNA-binding SARP family transcriptional activator/WD40 repeat protein